MGAAYRDRKEVLVVGRVKINATVSYTHPDWDTAMYDSEDKVLIPFDSVTGETEVSVEANFSMTILVDERDNPIQIDEFGFTDDRFRWIVFPASQCL
jgi:hypothetical protein